MSNNTFTYETACVKLGLSCDNDVSMKELKRAYHKKALQYHPDKNADKCADDEFKSIHEAYEYAMKENGYMDDDTMMHANTGDQEEKESSIPFAKYSHLLYSFLEPIIEMDTFQDLKSKLLENLLENIGNKCETKALHMFENMNRKQFSKIRKLLHGNCEVFHIPKTFLEKMDELYLTKFENDECVRLSPTMHDLLNENVYKLVHNEHTFFVPLWHHELVYDCSGTDLYVQCIPKLDNNIEIDEKNNIHITLNYRLMDIWEKDTLSICLGRKSESCIDNATHCNKTIHIPRSQLKMEKKQTITLVQRGISRIHSSNIYDVSKKGDINIHIEIEP